MRARTALPLIMTLLGCTIILVEPQYSTSAPQKGGFGKDGGGKGGFKGGGKMDPAKIFDDYMSKGRGFFLIEEARFGKDELQAFAKQNNISDGKITKDMYMKFWAQREELKAKKDNPDGKGKTDVTKDGPRKGSPGGNSDDNTRADEMFKRYDKSEDGFLNAEEIALTQRFKNEWEKWDKNGDKLISLAEWRDYFKDLNQRQAAAREERKGDPDAKKTDVKVAKGVIVIEEDEAPLPPIYRAGGKLPTGVPAWFMELDKDKDGQVSLYEWKTATKDIEEFVKMDRNDDGFLTIEEVLYYQNFVVNAGAPRTGTQATIIAGQKKDANPEEGKRKKGGGKKKFGP